MKFSATLLSALLSTLAPLCATVTISSNYGQLRDSSGDLLANTATLWALIYDDNNDGSLPGNLPSDSSLISADSANAHAAFAGLTIAQDLDIGGDRVIALGEFNDPSSIAAPFLDSLDLAAESLTVGRSYGFYWFPGATLSNPALPIGTFQIGGITEPSNTDFGDLGMVIPADSNTVATVIIDSNLGGPAGLPTSRFTAIDAIPEPSTSLLGLFAGLLCLRRRRRC